MKANRLEAAFGTEGCGSACMMRALVCYPQVLLFVLDLAGMDEHDPVKTLQMLKDEISAYE